MQSKTWRLRIVALAALLVATVAAWQFMRSPRADVVDDAGGGGNARNGGRGSPEVSAFPSDGLVPRNGDRKPAISSDGESVTSPTPFEVTPKSVRDRMYLHALKTDLTLTDEIVAFLGLTEPQRETVEAQVRNATDLCRSWAADHVYVVEEAQGLSTAVVEANPNAAEIRDGFKASLEGTIGDEKTEYLWRQMGGPFQSYFADFGEKQMVIQITPAEYAGQPGYTFEIWNVKNGLFPTVADLVESGRISDPSIAVFRGTFRRPEIPPYLEHLVQER